MFFDLVVAKFATTDSDGKRYYSKTSNKSTANINFNYRESLSINKKRKKVLLFVV